jgi:hypothetical protein
MIEFKKNVKKVLPYDRRHYIEFLDDDFDSTTEWCGVSFQLDYLGKNINITEPLKIFGRLFEKIVSKLDSESFWIINHDDKDLNWFPDNDDNLFSLRDWFRQNGIPNTFRGSLILMKSELLKFSKDLILYPYLLSYKNLDISHSELQFVIKITNHLTIDLLSTNKELLRKIINESFSKSFNIKQYRGTSL